MNTSQLIRAKFHAWARRHRIPLQGSKGDRGEKNYTLSIEANLLGNNLAEEVRKAFVAGAGGELRGDICSLQAMHSSAAMTVNVFQYWLNNQDLSELAKLLSIPSTDIERLSFEKQLPVCAEPTVHGFEKSPHLDVCFEYKRRAPVGVECKLHEPFGRENVALLSREYLKLSNTWNDIPNWKDLARKLTNSNLGFKRLGPSQLVKHVLGLKYGRKARDVRLIYFYFDSPGPENTEHLDEIDRFGDLISADPIRFQPISIQEFIAKANRELGDAHFKYLQYLSDRYY